MAIVSSIDFGWFGAGTSHPLPTLLPTTPVFIWLTIIFFRMSPPSGQSMLVPSRQSPVGNLYPAENADNPYGFSCTMTSSARLRVTARLFWVIECLWVKVRSFNCTQKAQIIYKQDMIWRRSHYTHQNILAPRSLQMTQFVLQQGGRDTYFKHSVQIHWD